MRSTRLNTAYFAEIVTYVQTVDGEDVEAEIPAHVRHRIRRVTEPDGSERIVEVIDVELDRADVEAAPTYQDRIVLAEDDRPYLYAHQGRHRPISWCAAFEREQVTAIGNARKRA